MKRTLPALFASLLVLPIAAYSQSDGGRLNIQQPVKAERLNDQLHLRWAITPVTHEETGSGVAVRLGEFLLERGNERVLAGRAIEILKILQRQVITYDSLGDFQESGKLANVPFEVFKVDLEKVSTEAEIILAWLPQNRWKNEIVNALRSYQDGAFWWEKTHSPRVVDVPDLASASITRTAADSNYLATTPYTIAINWRHGSRYIARAEKALGKSR